MAEKHTPNSKTKNTDSNTLVVLPEESTPFDDVYRTLLEKCRQLIIPVINECFKTSYDITDEVTLISNEHYYVEENKILKRITDSCIRIKNQLYHIECQSTKDTVMELRMIEYDFHIALSESTKDNHERILRFPESAVLYLRGLDEIPDQLSVKIILPDKSEANYHIPTIKLQNYDKQEILHKNLLFFIPYYILKFEEKLEIIDSQEDKLEEVITDYQEIYEHLRRLEEQQYIDNDYLHNLLNLIQKLIDVVAHDAQNFRRRVSIMGGKVLELPSEQIRRDGRAEGEVQAKKKMVRNLHKQGDSLKKIADAVEMSTEEVKEILSEPHEKML